MIVYADTSALLKMVVSEPDSPTAAEIFDGAERLITSRVTYPESRAALAVMVRERRFPRVAYTTAKAVLERRWTEMIRIDVTEELAKAAGDLADRRTLKGFDAIHLASALRVQTDRLLFLTWDRTQARAARAEGLMVAGIRP